MKGTVGKIFVGADFVIKEQPLTPRARAEMEIVAFLNAQGCPFVPQLLAAEINAQILRMAFPRFAQTCAQFLQNYGESVAAVDEKWWVQFLQQLAAAVEYLETQKINHNDLTLNNIMFDDAGAVKIIDFGSATRGISAFILGRDLNYFLQNVASILPPAMRQMVDQNIIFPGPDTLKHYWPTSGANLRRIFRGTYAVPRDPLA